MLLKATLRLCPGRSEYVVIVMGRGGTTSPAVKTVAVKSAGRSAVLTPVSLGRMFESRRSAEEPAPAVVREADGPMRPVAAVEQRGQPSADES